MAPRARALIARLRDAQVLARALCAALIGGATARFAALHWGCLYDDAYIYFRYVQVARQGCFYCFNAGGPRVEGVTSPLQFLALLGASLAGVRPIMAATALGASSLAAALVVTAWTPLRPGLAPTRAAGLAACAALSLLSLDHYLQLNAVIGLETPLAMLLVALVARSALTPGHPRLGLLAVLASLARPEATLFAALLPALPAMRSARRLGPVAAALLATAAARLALFGDVVPNTYRAKAGGGADHLVAGLSYLAETLRDMPLCALAPAALWIPGARDGVRYLLAASALWLAFLLRSGGDHFGYGRLVVPLAPTLVMLGACGAMAALARLSRARSLVFAAPLAIAAGLVALASVHHLPPQHGFDNVVRWIRLGRALRARLPGRSIATVPIGAIAYFSQARVIDLVGLTEPAIARAGRGLPPGMFQRNWLGHERHLTEWVLAQRPDLVVTTRWRDRPWRTLDEAQTGFYADRLILAEIRAGRAPYGVRDLEVSPGVHWLLFERRSP